MRIRFPFLLVVICAVLFAVSRSGARKPAPNFYTESPSAATVPKETKDPAGRTAPRSNPTKPSARKAGAQPSKARKPTTSHALPPPPFYLGTRTLLLAAAFTASDSVLLHLTAAEILRFRKESAQQQALIAGRVLNRLTPVIERRERNVRNASVALVLLHQASDGSYLSGELLRPHLVAVSSTLAKDARTLQREKNLWETLRTLENRSIERLKELGSGNPAQPGQALAGLKLPAPPGAGTPVTRSEQDEIRALLSALFDERRLGAEEADALWQGDLAARRTWERLTLASMAPALPAPAPDVPSLQPIPPERPPGSPPEDFALSIRTGPDRLVRAAADGTTVFAGHLRGSGHVVILEHSGGLYSVYEGLKGVRVGTGQAVRVRQVLGDAGGPVGEVTGVVRFQVRRGLDNVAASELLGSHLPQQLVVSGGT